MKLDRFVIVLVLIVTTRLLAQTTGEGAITGSVFDQTTGRPVEYVTLALKGRAGGKTMRTAVTDNLGAFVLEDVPFGEYKVVYGLIGFENRETSYFIVDAQHRSLDLGRLFITETGIRMDRVVVSARQEAFYNSIDRKVYNVGKDIQSVTGTASDLLQNIPSVQVDIDGNVSLRGNENVLILVNGKTSTLMGPNRAAVLEQMPADSIDKIEVITNPSAKYKPDGTAGIINIAMKKKRDSGSSGSVRVSVGNENRYNAGVSANYNPGKYNASGSANLRQDDRIRTTRDNRSHIDAATNQLVTTEQDTTDHARPLSRIAQAGVDYKVDEQNKLEAAASYNYRSYVHHADERDMSRDYTGATTADYDRLRNGPEVEKDLELTVRYQHAFAKEGHELSLELKRGRTTEDQDNEYTNVHHIPATAPTFDKTLLNSAEAITEAIAEYVYPLDADSKFEAGYDLQKGNNDYDHFGGSLDPMSGVWLTDPQVTNHFTYDQTIHALYGTYTRPVGKFGFLAGLRLEQSSINADQVTAGLVNQNQYLRAYPSLHLSYHLTDQQQLQWNYSHRVHRPESEDLNPYPTYQDPYNLRAGNPRLLPEETHSIEAGYQYKNNETSYLATFYYRYTYHGITDVSQYISSTTLLTTKQNLSKSQSGGLELAATADIGSRLSINCSSNAFYNEIDASNLGYSANKSTIAWNAKLGANLHLAKNTLIQCNANYAAKRLTAQGYRRPTFVANVGLRHDFKGKKTSLIVTVSDAFNSLKERTLIDTPVLHDEITRRRSARVVYVGFICNFGKPTKKSKDDTLQYDNQF
jgi:outer membrane receptor protein involved in Fe transport